MRCTAGLFFSAVNYSTQKTADLMKGNTKRRILPLILLAQDVINI